MFSAQLNGWRSVGLTSRFVLPMFLFIAIANPIFNHRGVTMLCMLFDQWFTLEGCLLWLGLRRIFKRGNLLVHLLSDGYDFG